MFYADLHVHSRFSRACSKNCTIPELAWWARRKGITVVGTGDFTHPAWAEELRNSLLPAEPGLFQLRPELEAGLRRTSPGSCGQPVRFMLSTEISTIYRAGERTRKVHHLLYAPTLEAAGRITAALAKIGNLASDGRPILGLDSRHLLDITLSAGPGCYLIPAHIWTPWFAVLGSKSGFDAVADCYGDLAGQVFAVETGLSSDPPMNWMCSALDGYRLVSNSDAHSPPMLGREATMLDTGLDYFAIERALRTGDGLAGTVNFFPEGGRYHQDGHRKCGVRLEPAESARLDGRCPECGKPLTIGVLNRVAELADREAGFRPEGAAGSANLVALPEIVSEIVGTGPKSKKVTAEVTRLVAALGPELPILREVPATELSRAGGSALGEAISRLRRGEVRKEAGYDGEYGVIRLFQPGELDRGSALFDVPAAVPAPRAAADLGAAAVLAGPVPVAGGTGAAGRWPGMGPGQAGRPPGPARPGRRPEVGTGTAGCVAENGVPAAGPAGSLLSGLDPDQRAAAAAAAPLMIIAGPGTGKTHTLTCRIAAAVAEQGVRPQACLAITFTRRAAAEMRLRLAALLGRRAARLTVTTFHGLGLMILREQHELAGLPPDVSVADEQAVLAVATELAGSPRDGRALLAAAAADPERLQLLRKALAARHLVDFDGLVDLTGQLLREQPALAARLRERWPLLSVDEYQDIDAAQYALLRLLAGDGSGLTVIGDPDQAIYGFRGADVGFFLRFGEDYPAAATVQLTRNYRSSPAIVAGAVQAIAPDTLLPHRVLQPVRQAGAPAITFHQAPEPAGEAAWIAEAIDRLLGGSSFHSLDSGRADGHEQDGIGLADIAVLYRTDAQAALLGQGLARAGLPFQKRSHDLLSQRPGVTEIVLEMQRAASERPGTAAGAAGAGAAGAVAGAGAGPARPGPGRRGPGRGGPGRGLRRGKECSRRCAAPCTGWPCQRATSGPGCPPPTCVLPVRSSARLPVAAGTTWTSSVPRSRWAPRWTPWTRGRTRSAC